MNKKLHSFLTVVLFFTLQNSFAQTVLIDPTGAGDALCAGIIYGLLGATRLHSRREVSELTPDELIQILLLGEAAGAACVTKVGTTTAVNKENIEKVMKEQKTAILGHILRTSLEQ